MTAVAAFVRRDLTNAVSYRMPFAVDAVFGVLQLAVYYFISEALGEAAPSDLGGAPTYFAFAAVGIVMSLVIEAAVQGLGDRVRSEQLSGTLEVMLAHPVQTAVVSFGLCAFPLLFAVARAVLYLLVAAVALDLHVDNTDWLGVAVMFIVSGLAFLALGILVGAVIIIVKRGQVVADIGIFALTLLSGALFPVSALPSWLEAIAPLSPLTHAYDGMRQALFTAGGWSDDALVLVIFAILASPIAVLAFGHALRLSRRQGTLSQY